MGNSANENVAFISCTASEKHSRPWERFWTLARAPKPLTKIFVAVVLFPPLPPPPHVSYIESLGETKVNALRTKTHLTSFTPNAAPPMLMNYLPHRKVSISTTSCRTQCSLTSHTEANNNIHPGQRANTTTHLFEDLHKILAVYRSLSVSLQKISHSEQSWISNYILLLSVLLSFSSFQSFYLMQLSDGELGLVTLPATGRRLKICSSVFKQNSNRCSQVKHWNQSHFCRH